MTQRVDYHNVAETLNELIKICEDSQAGFQQAVEHAKDLSLQALFNEYAVQRLHFKAALQDMVVTLSTMPESKGHTASALHRGWIDVKSRLTGANDHAVLAECERGEDAAVAAYREAMMRELTPDAKTLVQAQFAQVKEAHDRIRALRDNYKEQS